MIYRKSPPHPPTLLLRIVATAGAGALLGVAACSSNDSAMGAVNLAADSGDERAVGMPGVTTLPPAVDASASDSPAPCNGGPCGSVTMPQDASESGDEPFVVITGVAPLPPDSGDAGVLDGSSHCCVGVVPAPHDAGEAASPDSGSDARSPCGGGLCGVMIHPEGGLDQ